MRVSKKYLAPSIYSYPYWRLKSNIRFYKGVFCLFGHPHLTKLLLSLRIRTYSYIISNKLYETTIINPFCDAISKFNYNL